MTDVASLDVWPLGDLPGSLGVCVRRALPLFAFALGPVALGPRVLSSNEPITPEKEGTTKLQNTNS